MSSMSTGSRAIRRSAGGPWRSVTRPSRRRRSCSGVTESDPIDFFIYADEATFRAALGPSTRENVGGQAHPDIRTLFALITPADIDASWVESVVPHELTHLVFATAVDNPYHDPPHWLNEGLAVYLADGYDDFDRGQVEQAVRDGSIIPLDGLAGAFPTTQERFFLAYAESVSAVERIDRVNGPGTLVKLIRSYAEGVSDDQAFEAALGRDVAGFEADWLQELGAKPPTRLGPKPAPAGPLPEGWSGPQPNPSFEVLGSAPPVPPSAPRPTGVPEDPLARFLTPSLSVLGAVLVVVLVALGLRQMRRRPAPAGWAETGDNRLFGRPRDDGSDQPGATDTPIAGPETPSRLWGATDWSLPRDPDAPAPDAASGDLDTDAGTRAESASAGRGRGRRRPSFNRRPALTMATIGARIRAIPSWQLTLGFALLALGFLIAAQLAAEGPRIRYTTLERSPLVQSALTLQAQQADLKTKIVALRKEIQEVELQGTGSAAVIRDLNARLSEARIAAGLLPLTGTGIVLKLEDSTEPVAPGGNETDYLVGAADLRIVVALLWQSGAEAVAINHERITSSSAIVDIGGSVLVNAAYIAGPYQIAAIGPKDLFAKLSAAPGWEEFVRTRRGSFGIGISWAEPAAVEVDGFAGSVTLRESRSVPSPAAVDPATSPSAPSGAPGGSAP